jgi:hypothetical protein
MTRTAVAVAPVATNKAASSKSSSLLLQRKCACGGSAGSSGQCEACGKNRLPLQRRAASPATGLAPPIVHEVLRSPGQSLDPATRAFVEPRFGHDFGRVRVHADARAAQSADAVNALAYTVGRDVVFGAGRYAPRTDDGRHLLYHELTHVAQQRGGAIKGLQRANGPQSPAVKQAGTETVDPKLKAENKTLEREILEVAETYYRDNDLRWLFAYAHGTITQQINDNLAAFEQPNELVRLNLHFGRAFLRAARGKPSKAWKVAFLACKGLEIASWLEPTLVGETELCGAAMAKVHIDIDLSNALQEIGCISPTDYGNMLLFVERGSFAALVRLRGETMAEAEDMVQKEVAPILGLDVKAWRNAAYQKICGVAVPDVEPGFPKRVVQRTPADTGASSELATRHQDHEGTPGGHGAAEELLIGAPDDSFERDAERMADAMVRQPARSIRS